MTLAPLRMLIAGPVLLLYHAVLPMTSQSDAISRPPLDRLTMIGDGCAVSMVNFESVTLPMVFA